MKTIQKPKLASAILALPTSRIKPDPDQPRKEFDPEYIERLGASIKAEGLLQPITVRPDPEYQGDYIIVAGECRWRAHCHAGIQAVECRVNHSCANENDRFRKQVMENMARKAMSLKDEAFAAHKMSKLGDSDKTIATAIGYSVRRMRNIRRMTILSSVTWERIEAGTINSNIAEYVMGAVPSADVEEIMSRINGKNRAQAGAIVDSYVDRMNQESLELACQQAGVANKQDSIARQISVLLIQAAEITEGLSTKNQSHYARKLGVDVSKMVAHTKHTKQATVFIAKAMNRVNAEI